MSGDLIGEALASLGGGVDTVYVCGPPGMAVEMVTLCGECGVAPERIQFESWW